MKLTLEAVVPGKPDVKQIDHLLDSVVGNLEKLTGANWTVKMDGEIVRFASKSPLLRSKVARGVGGYVIYDASPLGYKVLVFDAANKIIDEYTAGNSPSDSAASDPKGGIGYGQLLGYAESTASEMAAEHGIDRIEHDSDILEEERASEGIQEGTLPPLGREL